MKFSPCSRIFIFTAFFMENRCIKFSYSKGTEIVERLGNGNQEANASHTAGVESWADTLSNRLCSYSFVCLLIVSTWKALKLLSLMRFHSSLMLVIRHTCCDAFKLPDKSQIKIISFGLLCNKRDKSFRSGNLLIWTFSLLWSFRRNHHT